jgi:hypothetical protein
LFSCLHHTCIGSDADKRQAHDSGFNARRAAGKDRLTRAAANGGTSQPGQTLALYGNYQLPAPPIRGLTNEWVDSLTSNGNPADI